MKSLRTKSAPVYLLLIAAFCLAMMLAGCGNVPDTPSGLTVTSTSPITLSWNSVSGAASYSVYRGSASGDISAKTVLASSISGTSYIDSAAVAGSTYYYQVKAFNADGSSSGSNEVQATQAGSSLNLVVSVSGTQINLYWSTISDSDHYKVYRGTSASALTVLQSSVKATTLADTTVTRGVTYYYQVAAVNAAGAETQLSSVVNTVVP